MTKQSADACKGCPVCPPPPAWTQWVSHLIRLQNWIEAGCRFAADDLAIDEWDGLAELRIAQDALSRET